MEEITLSNGVKIPMFGFGTWNLENNSAKQAIVDAIKIGYRQIDCASVYGNEMEIGEGINQAIQDGLLKRDELFITSKLWNTDHAPEFVFDRQDLDMIELYNPDVDVLGYVSTKTMSEKVRSKLSGATKL